MTIQKSNGNGNGNGKSKSKSKSKSNGNGNGNGKSQNAGISPLSHAKSRVASVEMTVLVFKGGSASRSAGLSTAHSQRRERSGREDSSVRAGRLLQGNSDGVLSP